MLAVKNRNRFLLLVVGICLSVSTLTTQAAPLSRHEKKVLRRQVLEQFYQSPRVVYDNQNRKKRGTGFITSNESHFYTLHDQVGTEPSDIHVGFATTINFNFLGMRPGAPTRGGGEKVRTAIFADQSSEVLMSLNSFWRPMFLISKTPTEWLAHIARIPVRDGMTVWDVFNEQSARKTAEPITEQERDLRIEAIRVKLNEQVQAGTISDIDLRFSLAILEEDFLLDQSAPYEVMMHKGVFNRSMMGNGLSRSLAVLYDFRNKLGATVSGDPFELSSVSEFDEFDLNLAQAHSKTSFLLNPDQYQRVRNVFLADQDFYAQTQIQDNHFWDAIQNFAKVKQQKVTDVYLTCIPQFVRKQMPHFDHFISKSLREIPGEEKQVYESTCGSYFPTIFKWRNLNVTEGIESAETPCLSTWSSMNTYKAESDSDSDQESSSENEEDDGWTCVG